MGAIGGADFAQAAARARHDRGNAERSADFDELAARDDHLLARRERSEHQQYRGGVVVHHRGGLSAGEFGEQRFDMSVAVATRAGCEVVLEIARLRHDRPHGFDGLRAWTKDSSASSVNTDTHYNAFTELRTSS